MTDDQQATEIRELAQLLADIKRRAEYTPVQLAEALYQRGVRIAAGYPARRMSGNVRDFMERDKALCSKALDGNRELLARAAEMIDSAEKKAKQQSGVPLDDSNLT